MSVKMLKTSKVRTAAQPKADQHASGRKLGEVIATQIEDRIYAEKLPIGHRLGSEVELGNQVPVSRWTFREALSLLEQSGIIEIRRGVRGGIFVAAPLLEVAENRISSYLEFARSDPDELAEVQSTIIESIVDLAQKRMAPHERAKLQSLCVGIGQENVSASLEAIEEAWKILTTACGNPALSMLMGTISKLAVHASWYSTMDDMAYHGFFDQMVAAERTMLNACLSDSTAELREGMREFCELNRMLFKSSFAGGRLPSREGALDRAYTIYPLGLPKKKSEILVRDLVVMIGDSGWKEGLWIGSERELMARYNVGRSVVREAIRSLERLGAVSVGRGGASGVRVIAPDPAQVISASRRYLHRAGLTDAQQAEAAAIIQQYAHCITARSTFSLTAKDSAAHLFLAILQDKE